MKSTHAFISLLKLKKASPRLYKARKMYTKQIVGKFTTYVCILVIKSNYFNDDDEFTFKS